MTPQNFATRLALALALALPAVPAKAQHQGHGAHGAKAPQVAAAPAAKTASTAAYEAANDKMHKDMAITFSGDADVDFVRGMIPHHQGAIDMAEVVLKHGKDEAIRKWATDIIREQKREIAEMQAWLAKNGK